MTIRLLKGVYENDGAIFRLISGVGRKGWRRSDARIDMFNSKARQEAAQWPILAPLPQTVFSKDCV